jgi:NAD(P)-dependent dehydrogenase (short-subunit alcohol dehydrogenase family)
MSTTTVPIALVTGGGRGLGKSTALHLAKRGADVILTYKSGAAEAEATVAEIVSMGSVDRAGRL